jgi:hypothetical protein
LEKAKAKEIAKNKYHGLNEVCDKTLDHDHNFHVNINFGQTKLQKHEPDIGRPAYGEGSSV